MDADRPVLVIGAAGIDIKGRPREPLQLNTSNRGVVQNSLGGVARNVAENLARLEVPTILLSAIGQDAPGDRLLAHTAAAGVDVSYVLRVPEMHTGSYVAILEESGQLAVSVSEYDIVDSIAPGYIYQNRKLFAEAAMVAIDANLSTRALSTIFKLARRYDLPVCADPTSPTLATKLIQYLPDLYMAAPNAIEAAILCESDEPPANSELAVATAQCLVAQGVNLAIVTLAEMGLAYADGSSAGHIPALHTPVVDTTGVGDALTAAVLFGLLNAMPLDEAVRLGVSAASLTLRTRETVVPDLSLDRLYDQLII